MRLQTPNGSSHRISCLVQQLFNLNHAVRFNMMKSATLFLAVFKFPGLFGLLSLDNIYSELQDFTMKYPGIVRRSEIGKSFEGRPIYAMSIFRSQNSYNAKTAMIVEFGIHAREWASPASAVYLLEQLLTNPACEAYTQEIKWHVIPITNPDGYHFSLISDPLWRKNRRRYPNKECIGVDLNRNFPMGWGEGMSEKLCTDTYFGPNNFSEPETKALEGFVKNIVKTENVTAYVAVHSCAQTVLHPYGYTISRSPSNLQLLKKIGISMGRAMEQIAGNFYSVQSAGQLYVAGGGSDDWAYEEQSIPLVYTLELGYAGYHVHRSCFHPDNVQMRTLVRECFAALGAVAKFLDSSIDRKREETSNATSTKPVTRCPSNDASSDVATFSFFRLDMLCDAVIISVLWQR